MVPKIGEKYLITTDGWFFAPDGELYRAVFGTINGVNSDLDVLGIKTNSKSTDWYVTIGNMVIAGCQIHYAIKTDKCSSIPPAREIDFEGKLHVEPQPNSRIYFSDDE